MQVYITKMPKYLSEIEKLLGKSYRPLKKPARVQYRFLKDQLMHRIGDVIAQYSIEQWSGLKTDEWEYSITSDGKVEIQSHLNLYVNLSYSYPYITCIIDECPIGIDIEELKTLDYYSLAQHFSINELNQVSTLKDFFDIWTKKESYTKLIGEGLKKGLDYYDVTQHLYYLNERVKFKSYDYGSRLIQICHISKTKLNIEEISIYQLM
ncbi:4'-phosphopantetheinyl transferase superfamily protein [Staphylococcus saccharolyticus]|uniref:aureusimine biosynthesis 4'-phosphopantetheinyl transferase AusB n=1 Tax=Staphylococcus saccharolyticus TaxID=33028 RepID=UPI0032E00E06